MTDVVDPAETRVIFHNTIDTAVIGNATRDLTEHARRLPTTRVLRRAAAQPGPVGSEERRVQDTGEVPAWPIGAELAVTERLELQEPPTGTPPPVPPPPPPSPSWAAGAGEYPTVPGYRIVVAESTQVRPRGYRPEHLRQMPFWAGLVLHLGADVVGSALGSAAVLLWAVTR